MDSSPQSEENIRFVWNVTPSSKIQQARSVIHPAFHYTPLANTDIEKLEYVPLICSCQAVLNAHCLIDYGLKTIRCCFCQNFTALPAHYAKAISPNNLPYEFMPSNTTFCYKTDHSKQQKKQQQLPLNSNKCLLFVIDLCLLEKQIEAIKTSIISTLENVPTDGSVFIGLITFYKNVNVYQLASRINTVFCVNGLKQYKQLEVMNILGVQPVGQGNDNRTYEIFKRFIIPVNNKADLGKIIRRVRDIRKDQTIIVNERNSRATGQAVNVAVTLAQAAPVAPRIVFLIGGPCTVGPGTVIGLSLKQKMRSVRELSNGENIKYFVDAKKYYDSFGKKVVNKKIILDLFAFTLEEAGLAEMSELFMSSGGFIAMHEEFSDRIFKESFKKLYFPSSPDTPNIQLHSEAVISAYVSKDLVINGAFGHCHSLNKSKPFVSDKVIGLGNTHSWYLGSLDPQRSITILYETKDSETKERYFYVQLKTSYRDSDGVIVTQITTLRKEWSSQVHEIAQGFDQEAAIVYLARYCVYKSLMEEQKQLRKYLDSSLCKWASYFAQYIKGEMSSFSLPVTMRIFPQYIYHLRRSNFVNRFGSSFDESFYRAYILNRENPTNCSTMIQPILLKYAIDNLEPEPVPLDEEQMQDEVILLLDSYFNVIQWYGTHVHQWQTQKYHEAEEYKHVRDFFQATKQDIDYIMSTRFPVPNYYLTHPAHSKERYLKSRVNPKKTIDQQNENTLTDDSDLKAFSEHLVKVVTTQSLG